MTYSVPGLGWPEDASAWSANEDDHARGDAEAEAWLEEVASVAGAGAGGRDRMSGAVRAGGLPGRYVRRAARLGLGWPGDSADELTSTAPVRTSAMEASGAAGELGVSRAASEAGPGPAADGGEPAPERVRQALASVSRETVGPPTTGPGGVGLPTTGPPTISPGGVGPPGGAAALGAAGASSAAPAGHAQGVHHAPGSAGSAAPGSAASGSTAPRSSAPGRLASESEVAVAIPAVPDTSADTPIARAAQAAVVARSGGQMWPRPSSCRIITIANQKGGVGKTTTAVNLAASLAMHGGRVLVIDLDPQGNASTALDIEHHSGIRSVYNVLVDGEPLSSVVRPVAGFPHLYCAPAAIDLAGAEIELVPLVARESRLSRALSSYDASNLDYIFIDCPPSLGLLTVNALVAAPEVLIPIQCEYYALEGLEQLLRTVELVRSHLNPALAVTSILLTMYDGRTRLASQVADEVREHFGGVVLGSVIPRSVRVSEAPSYGQSVMTYDPGSSGAVAYLEAARELALRNAEQPAG